MFRFLMYFMNLISTFLISLLYFILYLVFFLDIYRYK